MTTIKKLIVPGLATCACLVCSEVNSAELVHEFINPSFGGSAYNGSYLLAIAESQNGHKAKTTATDTEETDELTDFYKNVQSQILYRLSREIVDAAFGEEGLEGGTYDMGGYQVTISESLTGIEMTILDPSTGNSTTVKVPYF